MSSSLTRTMLASVISFAVMQVIGRIDPNLLNPAIALMVITTMVLFLSAKGEVLLELLLAIGGFMLLGVAATMLRIVIGLI